LNIIQVYKNYQNVFFSRVPLIFIAGKWWTSEYAFNGL